MYNACSAWGCSKYSSSHKSFHVAEKRGGGSLTIPQGVIPQNMNGTKPNRSDTCMVLKAAATNRRKQSSICYVEFRWPRSGTAD
ncbi:hypothetical protein TNCV_4501971 [Trichonephila clavipes]|nr:hypothetical protein TNCV_4501971 [Trichonephila clavipes]